MKDIILRFKEIYKQKGKTAVIVTLGIVGILLIALSSSGKDKENNALGNTEEFNDREYCAELEQKASQIVTAVTGDKSPVVVVTLETGNEYIYADQNTKDSDVTADIEGESTKNKESLKETQEYIIIKGENGSETPLVITEKKPIVRGVAIVSNGLNEKAEEKILCSLSAVLGISSRKISLTNKNQ